MRTNGPFRLSLQNFSPARVSVRRETGPALAGFAAIAAFALVAATWGCRGDADTITGVQSPTATPTPAPSVGGDLGGEWIGTFTTNDDADCHSGDAHVQLTAMGERLTGSVSRVVNSCGFGGTLDATVSDGRVQGSLSPGGSFQPGAVTGTASPTEMHLTVGDMPMPPGPGGTGALIPGGRLDLHR